MLSYVDVQNRSSADRLWDVKSVLWVIGRFAGRLYGRRSSMESLSVQWCQQYEVDSAKR